MSIWYDATQQLPPDQQTVLAVKQKKDGSRDICLAYCIRDYERYDPVTRTTIKAPYWVCSGNNNVIMWTPLPTYPGQPEPATPATPVQCVSAAKMHLAHAQWQLELASRACKGDQLEKDLDATWDALEDLRFDLGKHLREWEAQHGDTAE